MNGDTFTLDHIVPKSKGGINHEMNYRPCCLMCNATKADMSVEEFRAVLTASRQIKVFHYEREANQ